MTKAQIIILVAVVLVVLGVIIFPQINKRQLKNMPFDQQVRILMKQANKLIYWKNIPSGTKGVLIYIKNKRKILVYPWVLIEGKMLCTKDNPFDHWDYPEEHPKMSDEEIIQARKELEKYNNKTSIKLYLQNSDTNNVLNNK
jgi:hypothetical protein